MILRTDPDEFDRLLIHEICHAVADAGHGKVWQARMQMAAHRAGELGRDRLAELLREEIVNYQQRGLGLAEAYDSIRDALNVETELTFTQIKRWLADQYGLLVSEVCTTFRRAERVYREARKEAQEARAIKEEWQRQAAQPTATFGRIESEK